MFVSQNDLQNRIRAVSNQRYRISGSIWNLAMHNSMTHLDHTYQPAFAAYLGGG
jgi:hypothetical protein